jgi:regulator of sirC expression with transglutaminase-like and TPR domain
VTPPGPADPARAARRFADLVAGPEADVLLDVCALVLASCFRPGLDVAPAMARLDAIAAVVTEPTLDGLCAVLFSDLGFTGDRATYDAPDNSLLDRVLERRLGLPITLTVLTIVVGRRIGVPVVGIGLPGHFLAGDGTDPSRLVDPFSGGAALDVAACERLFHHLHGAGVEFTPTMLAPVGSRQILTRMLANLVRSYEVRRQPEPALLARRLQAVIPGRGVAARRELAQALARRGRFDEAGAELEAAAAALAGPDGDVLRAEARQLRARLN